MPSSTVEDYIKRLYLAEQELPLGSLVSMGDISNSMKVQPGTATSMMKTLVDSGLVIYEPRQGVRLTEGGKKLALHILRSHRLLELFLVKTLGYDWSEVHEEAEMLEHVASEKLLSRIDSLLGFPDTDPHGDPIPDASGTIRPQQGVSSSDTLSGKKYKLVRVSNQEPEFLQVLAEHDITPGAIVSFISNDTLRGTITMTSESGRVMVLGESLARHLFFEVFPDKEDKTIDTI